MSVLDAGAPDTPATLLFSIDGLGRAAAMAAESLAGSGLGTLARVPD